MTLSVETLNTIINSSLEDSKAIDICAISLIGKTSIADAMVVATGTSSRHVSSIAENLAQALKDAGLPEVQIEGLGLADWVLVDAGDIIIHIFRPEVREHYALEKMWAYAESVREAQPA